MNQETKNNTRSSHLEHFIPFDADGLEEFTVAVIGSVDSSKSTTIGVLITGELDDGNGKARSIVFKHPHEHETGRTSDISYNYLKLSNRVINFIDLAGHDKYLRTTINGLTSGFPDVAIVCISDKITQMTTEHIGLALCMHIPIIILMTKSDMVPKNISDFLLKKINKRFELVKKQMLLITDQTINNFDVTQPIIPYLYTSNKKGDGIELLKQLINKFPKRQHQISKGFVVEHQYNVKGYGLVVSGVAGIDIKKGDKLYFGPFPDKIGDVINCFLTVSVKTIHNDYKYFIDVLKENKRGCLCLNIDKQYKPYIRPGMILLHKPVSVYKKFIAKVKIFQQVNNIKHDYQIFANCGMIREPVKFNKIRDMQGNEIHKLDNGCAVEVEIEFCKNLNYLENGMQIVFREGLTRGFGVITQILE